MNTNKTWLAHIAEDGRTQPVEEHLKNTAALSASFASAFGAEEQGRLVGMAHDIGKCSDEFQRRLYGGRMLNRFISQWKEPQSDLNRRRAEILRACIDGGGGDKGLYTLTVPTGGGKTIASMAFALNHAVKHKMDRVIYPYLQEKMPWGLIPHVQALLLARFIRGDIDDYPPFLWK